MEHTRRLLVLGNGPSLKKEFFDCFGEIPCLGMNAAYRYWHRINWYPRIYCCLDDQLVLSHADAIRDLATNHLCQVFFLHQNILDRYPELAALPQIYFLPQLRPGANNREICKRLNIPHCPSVWFKSYQPSKLTTGAYSVRFAAHLGYRQIGLLGTDCRFVEIVQGAQSREGIVLEIVGTPSSNPNYFFDDYQRVGDLYNLPNPPVHGGNLHLQAFEALAEDVRRFGWDLDIGICTTESEIYDHDVFPYVPLYRFIARASLSAIFMPFTKHDLDLLEQNLLRWGQQEFTPFSEAPAEPTIELHFAMNGAVDKKAEARLKNAFRRARLDQFFKSLSFHYSNLSGLDDQYTRVAGGDVGSAGYMAGPNNQFFDIVRSFAKGMSHILLMEPDAVPIRPNWLKAAEDIVRGSERFWINGSHYRGTAMITSVNHINGNAIYNVGDTQFRTFFENVFVPYFHRRVKDNPSICYDIVLYDMFAKAYAKMPSEEVVALWKETAHLFRFSEWIVDVSHANDREAHVLMSTVAAQKRYPNSYVVHGAVENLFGNRTSLAAGTRSSSSSAPPAVTARIPAARQFHIISLNPQLTDSLGHPLAYDSQLSSACAQRGVKFVSAANKQLDPGLMELHPQLRAVFSDEAHKSGVVKGDTEPAAAIMKRFRREVEAFVDRYLRTCDPEDKVILYLYTGGLPHIEALYDIVKARPQVSAHITLFWLGLGPISHEALRQRWAGTLRKALIEPRLALTVLTREMQREIQEAAGVVLPVAPAPSTTFDDIEARNVLEQSELRVLDKAERADFSVVFPGLMRKPKGYDLSISVIQMLREKQTGKEYKCTLRYVPREGTPPELIDLVQRIRGLANIVEGILPLDEFQRLLRQADIIVLPYQPSEFSNRTSSILTEALLCGVPVVVQKGTWLGNLVARYDCGVLAETASPEAYVKAIELVAANHHQYRKNAISAGKEWLGDNTWATLLDFILEPPPPLSVPQGTIPAGPQRKMRNVFGKIVWRGGTRVTSLRDRELYQRLVGYLNIHYPPIITIGRVIKWSLTTLKNTFVGIGGIAVFVIAGLYIAGALIEPVRWYLVGTASALLLLCGGLLALFYARLVINRIVSEQRTQVSDINKKIKQVSDINKALRKSEAELKKEISDSKDTLAKMNVGNFPLFQNLNRRLTNEDLKRFAGEWAPKLGLNLTAAAIGYMAHRICLAEDTCVGRLVGNIETMLLRVLVARSVMEPNLEVLEIGTLFGVGVAMIHENCRGLFDSQHFTVIDPLIGHIGRHDTSFLDPLTKAPATREIFIHNMQRMNIPKADYTIIEKLSTEDEAIKQASKRRYNLLIIDADHSYFGVKHDFYNYRYLVKRGGYIIFDDYGNPNWPGLTDFVDNEVAKMPELEFVGTDVFSAVFRVIASQDSMK